MSFKSKVLAGAASLALVGGVAVVGGLSASYIRGEVHTCVNLFKSPTPRVIDFYIAGPAIGSAHPCFSGYSSLGLPADKRPVLVNNYPASDLLALRYSKSQTSIESTGPAPSRLLSMVLIGALAIIRAIIFAIFSGFAVAVTIAAVIKVFMTHRNSREPSYYSISHLPLSVPAR